jgi:hypothetical protein
MAFPCANTELGLGVMVCSVMGLGMYEGYLLTKKRSLDMETVRFITRYRSTQQYFSVLFSYAHPVLSCARYGWENLLPSFIWKTKQAATIVRAQGREFPSKLLWTPSHPITSEEASRQVHPQCMDPKLAHRLTVCCCCYVSLSYRACKRCEPWSLALSALHK